MTKEQLNIIRARAEFLRDDPGVIHDGGTGDLYVQDTTALLDEVERLTTERDTAKNHLSTLLAFQRGVDAMRAAVELYCTTAIEAAERTYTKEFFLKALLVFRSVPYPADTTFGEPKQAQS